MPEKSKTKQAIEWLAFHPGKTIYEAAKRHGVSYSSVWNAYKRATRPRCPTCGQILPAAKAKT